MVAIQACRVTCQLALAGDTNRAQGNFAAPDCSSLGFVRGLLLRDGREWEEYLQDKEDWILIVLLGSAPLTIPSPQEQASAGFWLVDGEWC